MSKIIKIGDNIDSPDFTFDEYAIVDFNGNIAVNVIGRELSADSLEVSVEYDDADGRLRAVSYATPVYCYTDDILAAMFFFTRVIRTGKTRYKIYGTSFIGLLDKEPSYGGMFLGTKFKAAVTQLICSDGVEKYARLSGFVQQKTNGASTQHGTLLSSDGYGQATYKSKIEVKFKFLGYISLGYYIPIAGCQEQYTATRDPDYCIQLGGNEVTLRYDHTKYVLFTSNVYRGSTYTVTVDPVAGTYEATQEYNGTIRRASGSFTASTDSSSLPIFVAGFGMQDSALYDSSTSLSVFYEYFRVYDASGNLILDVVPLMRLSDGKLFVRNEVTGFTAEHVCGVADSANIILPESSVIPDTILTDELKNMILRNIEFDEAVESIPIYGWAPVGTKREALYQVLFAARISIVRNGSAFLFTRLSNDVAGSISERSIYDSGSVAEKEDVRKIELTEHDFSSPDDTKVIFDNTSSPDAANNSIVQFSGAPIYGEPVIAATVGTFEVLAYNCNAAIVSGKGKLTGTPYIHGKKLHKKTLSGSVRGKTVSVSNAMMVTALNAPEVLERLAAYYDSAYRVSNSFVYANAEESDPQEKCGSRYSFLDCFNEEQTGFLQKMGLTLSEKTKANGEFICGFVNPASSDFTNFIILTGSGTWTKPEGVTKIRAVLIGGGNGGEGGYKGMDGDSPRTLYEGNEWRTTVKAEGGAAGQTGSPGKVYAVTIDNPADSYSYACGAGGTGGAGSTSHDTTNAGGIGGESTLTGNGSTISSASGETAETGFVNYFNGHRYAFKPIYWTNGAGKGGDGGYYTIDRENNVTFYEATDAYNEIADYKSYHGANGTSINGSDGKPVALGGCGGGGTLLRSGYNHINAGDGGNASMGYGVESDRYYAGIGGRAGGMDYDGYQPTERAYYVPTKGDYGVGGIGGVGGGGGGAGGCIRPGYYGSSGSTTYNRGANGGKGGDGGDGCIIIYY